MPDLDQVRQTVTTAVEEFNRGRADEEALPTAPETKLIGSDGKLDSLSLVSLIVAVEEQVEADHGASLTLADDKAFSMKHSPFASIQALTDYVHGLLENNSDG